MKNNKEFIAVALLNTQKKFTKKGYINSRLPWYSPKDLSLFIGKSRQYWCKLIKQGKLGSRKTSAGPIVTTEDLIRFYKLKK
jgi:hypothetical protein